MIFEEKTNRKGESNQRSAGEEGSQKRTLSQKLVRLFLWGKKFFKS
jgi:hypothetical protein